MITFSPEVLALILGVTAIIPGIFVLLRNLLSLNKNSFETGQDNKNYLEMVSAVTYEMERDTRATEFHQGVVVASEEYSRPELWSMGPIRLLSPSSGATITAHHYAYPETLKSAQTHCQFCGNKFVPDKFGRCSSCGGPQQ